MKLGRKKGDSEGADMAEWTVLEKEFAKMQKKTPITEDGPSKGDSVVEKPSETPTEEEPLWKELKVEEPSESPTDDGKDPDFPNDPT